MSPAAASLKNRRDARRAVAVYLAENDLTQADLATRLGTTSTRLGIAVRGISQRWTYYRLQLQIERLMGRMLWNDERAADELGQIGKRLGVDLLRADLKTIRRAARQAKIGMPDTYRATAPGFVIFRTLLTQFFPNSPTLKSAPYDQTA